MYKLIHELFCTHFNLSWVIGICWSRKYFRRLLSRCTCIVIITNEDMVEKLDSIGYGFFIPIFFVMVGVNLEVWSIFKEPSSMLMIPILIVGLFISKLLPSLVLRKWYPRNIVLGSAILLTSTLSLVIAVHKLVKNWRSSVQVYLPLLF